MAKSMFSKEELLNDLKRVRDICTHTPSMTEYTLHGNYSVKPFRNTFGSWGKAIEKIGGILRSNSIAKENVQVTKITGVASEVTTGNTIDAQILKLLKTDLCTVENICDILNLPPKIVKNKLEELSNKGYNFKIVDNQIKLNLTPSSVLDIHRIQIKPVVDEVTFAVVSDTHFGSIHAKIEELTDFYKIASDTYGIRTFLHCGDIVAGINMYRGQENELTAWGADKQVELCVSKYPKIKGCTTHFITGNHDLCYLSNSGKDIGVDIANKRDDMLYLGQYEAQLHINDLVKVEIAHPDITPAYAMSYSLQKMVQSYSGGLKPHVLLCGHLHQSIFLPDLRNMSSYLVGCFEGPSLWLKRKKLEPSIGAWIITVGVDEDGSPRVNKSAFVKYYEGSRYFTKHE